MIRRLSLSVKILLLASLNVVLLGLLVLVFARLQFRFDLGSSLLASAKANIVSVSRQIALELPNSPEASWTGLLQQYSAKYPAHFFLFNARAEQLAGPQVALPPDFVRAMRRDPLTREGQGPPPGERGEEPGPPPPPRDSDRSLEPERHGPPPMQDASAIFRGGAPFGPGEPRLALTKSSNPTCYWVGVRVPVWRQEQRRPLHATLVWQIPRLWTEPFFVDWRPWLAGVAAILATLILCWAPFIRDLTQGLRRLTDATGQIANGHFEVRLPGRRRDELGQLAQSIGTMAQRLSGYVHGQKRFLGDIAHELSSPIARIEVGLSILEQRVKGEEGEYLIDVRNDVDHMSALVSELLAFSKSQAAGRTLNAGDVLLEPLIHRVLERENASTVSVDGSISQSMPVRVIPELLERALANLVRNALRYAGAGPVVISARDEDKSVCLSVADEGPGLPEGELENVFRPFYRPEFARQAETGGTGLGLAIVRDSIEACHGSVFCRNRKPHGLEVVMRLPAAST